MGGRYETLFELARGGMATVYVGTVRGALGFRQLVAIKRPHEHVLADPDYKRELLSEARLASLIHHANVVDVRDVEADNGQVSLIMDYVEGASLAELLQIGIEGGPKVPPAIVVRIVLDACAGLHAAHELTDELGRPVQLVHRDVSPQNVLVGVDGVARVADFGVAKVEKRSHATTDGHLKGKLAYMAPEYLRGQAIDRRVDIFAMGIVLWEALTCQRLFRGEHEADTLRRVLEHVAPPPSRVVPGLNAALDGVVEIALNKPREHRFENAEAMGAALEASARDASLVASHRDVAEFVRRCVGTKLEERRAAIRMHMADEPSALGAGGVVSAPVAIEPTVDLPMSVPASAPVSPPPYRWVVPIAAALLLGVGVLFGRGVFSGSPRSAADVGASPSATTTALAPPPALAPSSPPSVEPSAPPSPAASASTSATPAPTARRTPPRKPAGAASGGAKAPSSDPPPNPYTN